jgi:hypothetical protein
MGFYNVPWDSMGFHDVPVNRSVPTEANRSLTSYMVPFWVRGLCTCFLNSVPFKSILCHI